MMDISNHSHGQAVDETRPGTISGSEDRVDRGVSSLKVITGLLLVKIFCCAGLLLLGTGALGAVGAALRNPYLVGVAITATAGICLALYRHRGSTISLRSCTIKARRSKRRGAPDEPITVGHNGFRSQLSGNES